MQGRRRGMERLAALKTHYRTEMSGGPGKGHVESYCLSDDGLTALAEGFLKLEKLSLIWCSNVTSVGLMALAQKCRYLKSLDLQVNVYSFLLLVVVFGRFLGYFLDDV